MPLSSTQWSSSVNSSSSGAKYKGWLAPAATVETVGGQIGINGVDRFAESHSGHNVELEPAIGVLVVRDKKLMRCVAPGWQAHKLKLRQDLAEMLELIGLNQEIDITAVFNFFKLFITTQKTIVDICLIKLFKDMQQ